MNQKGAAFFLAAILAAAGAVPAFAATGGVTAVPADGAATVLVNGTAEQTAIRVTVPTQLTFAIDPNAEAGDPVFHSVPAEVENRTLAPIDLKVVSIRAREGNAVRVVAEDAYADNETGEPKGLHTWGELGTADTESKIALGVRQGKTGETFWSPAEDAEGEAGVFKVVAGNGTEPGRTSMSVQAKHGNAWTGDITSLAYDLNVRVALSDTTPEYVE